MGVCGSVRVGELCGEGIWCVVVLYFVGVWRGYVVCGSVVCCLCVERVCSVLVCGSVVCCWCVEGVCGSVVCCLHWREHISLV